MSALEVRAMMPADLEAVAALARRADPFGWSLRNFQDALAAGYIMTVIEAEARIVGYFALMVVVDEAELLEIAVDPDFQGRGCGKTLLKAAVAAARAQACRENPCREGHVLLAPREGNGGFCRENGDASQPRHRSGLPALRADARV